MEEILIGRDDAGQRLDRFLRKYLRGATLPTVYKLIRTRQVRVNGKKGNPGQRLEEGDSLLLHPAEGRLGELRGKPKPASKAGKKGRRAPPPLDILHEDDHVLAVAKPAFLLVHEGEAGGEPTLIDQVEEYLEPPQAKTFRPALAHRLDRLTSGVVLVGKSAEGLRGLTEALREGRIEKTYLALSRGKVKVDEGKIDLPLRRDDLFAGNRPRVRVDMKEGRAAETRFFVLSRRSGLTLLRVRPMTGRTHQIRVHLGHIGHPILGDATYGDTGQNRVMRGRYSLWRHWLHALSVEFAHPVTGHPLRISAPLPEELLRVLDGERFPRGVLPEEAVRRDG